MSSYSRIQNAAIGLAREGGLSNITRDNVASRADVSAGLLYYYFPSVAYLRTQVMELAIERDDAALLMQGVRVLDPAALKAPEALKQEALELLSKEILGNTHG